MKKRLSLLVSLCCCCVNMAAWNIVAKPFPFFYDLYSNEIYDVYQDREGLVWVGTTSSVSFYDGFRLRTFRSDSESPHLLTNNRVRFIADSRSHVWITTERGITLYDKATGLTAHLTDERISDQFICDIRADGPDTIWLATHEKVYMSNADGSLLREYIPFQGMKEHGVNGIYVDKEHSLWLLAKNGSILRLRRHHDDFEEMPLFPDGGAALMMYQDRQGRYWLGTWGNGMWQMFPEGDDGGLYYRHYRIESSRGEEESFVYGIVQDDCYGYLWILGYNELHALEYTGKDEIRNVDVSHVLDPHKMFTKIMKDRQGNLWIGSYDEGFILYFDASGVTSYPLTVLKERIGWDVNLVSLLVQGDNIWLSQDRYGALLYDKSTKQLKRIGDDGVGEVSFLIPSCTPGKIWAVTRYNDLVYALWHQDDGVMAQFAFDVHDKFPNAGPVLNMTELKDGSLWIATPAALIRALNNASGWFLEGFPLPGISTMTSDLNDDVWCVASNDLYRVDHIEDKVEYMKMEGSLCCSDDEKVIRMAGDGLGNLWMMTSLGRLLQYETVTAKLCDSGLDTLWMDGSFQELCCAGTDVWIMTNKKLLKYDVVKDSAIVFDASDDQICVRAFRNRALCVDAAGIVYAGGHNGFIQVTVAEKEIMDQNLLCPVVTDVIVDGKSLFDAEKDGNTRNLKDVELLPSARNIEIRFSRWDYSLGEKVSMQFRLLGEEEEWNTFIEERPYAFYHQLSKGTFDFEVRLKQPDGSWGMPQNLMTIVRSPAWYETDVALWGYSITISLILVFFYIYMRKRYKKQHEVEMSQARMSYLAADHYLMSAIVQVVERHLDNVSFDLDVLADEMGMSKSTLHRKVKASMGVTPLDLIHNIRLKKACDMLEEGICTISEIAYAVGFSTPKYFTKCFKQAFGMTPSAYANRKREETRE